MQNGPSLRRVLPASTGPPLIGGGEEADRGEVAEGVAASTGPPLIGGGESAGRSTVAARVRASTGPPLIGGGESVPDRVAHRVGRVASTGPPLIGGGEFAAPYIVVGQGPLQRVRR